MMQTKNKGGRPVGSGTKLTPGVQHAICELLGRGIPFKYACEKHGISEMTGYTWLRQGMEGVAPYCEFSLAVTKAHATAVDFLSGRALSGDKGAVGAMWFLERRFRKDFGPVNKFEHSGPNGGAIEINKTVKDMTDEELQKLASRKSE